MFSENNNTVYYDKIDKLANDYNSRRHSSIGMKPVEASERKKPKFSVDDTVRISKYKQKVFDKGFEKNWIEEVFKISEILNTNPVTYRLVDLLGEKIEGSFYEQEIQKTDQTMFRMRK